MFFFLIYFQFKKCIVIPCECLKEKYMCSTEFEDKYFAKTQTKSIEDFYYIVPTETNPS